MGILVRDRLGQLEVLCALSAIAGNLDIVLPCPLLRLLVFSLQITQFIACAVIEQDRRASLCLGYRLLQRFDRGHGRNLCLLSVWKRSLLASM